MKKDTIDDMLDILIKWNKGEISSGNAMYRLWKLLQNDDDGELKKRWDKQTTWRLKNER